MNQKLSQLIARLESETDKITVSRKSDLEKLGEYISNQLNEHKNSKIIVICTHNSRRSHLGQIWLLAGAQYYGIKGLEAYSGGTEATAFNPRMVNALKSAGFEFKTKSEGENPIYKVSFDGIQFLNNEFFSKKFEDTYNPSSQFIAVMVCDSADEACPFVPGAEHRISLPYLDPKRFDDTALQDEEYLKSVRELGREMLFVLRGLGGWGSNQ